MICTSQWGFICKSHEQIDHSLEERRAFEQIN
jgi:hypothetical protein